MQSNLAHRRFGGNNPLYFLASNGIVSSHRERTLPFDQLAGWQDRDAVASEVFHSLPLAKSRCFAMREETLAYYKYILCFFSIVAFPLIGCIVGLAWNRRSKKLLRDLSKDLARVPSMAYALCYIFAIPSFAVAYTLLPYGFYHGTAKYEESLQDAANRLFVDHLNFTKSAFAEQSNGNKLKFNSFHISLHSIQLKSWQYSDSELSWTISAVVLDEHGSVKAYPDEHGRVKDFVEISLTLVLDGPSQLTIGNHDEPSIIYIKHKGSISDIFADLFINRIPMEPGLSSVVIPYPFHDRFKEISNTFRGFPSNTSGSFFRMLYLSVVTITTLGYGDIVPISGVTRMLLGLESFLGVVLIGLFLNSLAHESNESEDQMTIRSTSSSVI